LAFVDEFDLKFVVVLGFPKIWLMESYLGIVLAYGIFEKMKG
jgi:hypothetical protein